MVLSITNYEIRAHLHAVICDEFVSLLEGHFDSRNSSPDFESSHFGEFSELPLRSQSGVHPMARNTTLATEQKFCTLHACYGSSMSSYDGRNKGKL